MSDTELLELDKRRVNLKTAVNTAIRNRKPISFIKDKVKEYNIIYNKIVESGLKQPKTHDYLNETFWDTHTPDDVINMRGRAGIAKHSKRMNKEFSPEIDKNYYIINIAGDLNQDGKHKESRDNIYNIISHYIKYVYNINNCDYDFDDNELSPSYRIKFKIHCSESDLTVIKKTIECLIKDYPNEVYYTKNKK